WLVLVETKGIAAAADANLGRWTAPRRAWTFVAHRRLSCPAAAHFHRRAVHGDLWTDGSRLGAKVSPGQFLSLFPFYLLRALRHPGRIHHRALASCRDTHCVTDRESFSFGRHSSRNTTHRCQGPVSIRRRSCLRR